VKEGLFLKQSSLFKTVLAGLFAAAIYVTTAFISIPLGVGYANLGDCFVLVSGMFLGPIYGFCAAAVGSALADITLGWVVYAPVTFIIKGAMSIVFYLITKKSKRFPVSAVLGGILCEIIMVLGYFIFEFFLYGNAAFATLLGNSIQGLVGSIGAVLLSVAANKLNITDKFR
jgi:uncharacterized membrane protein